METYWIQTALLILAAFIIGLIPGKLLRKLFCRPVKYFDYGRGDTGEDSTYRKPNYGLPEVDKNRKPHLSGTASGAGAAGAAGLVATALKADTPDAELSDVEWDVDLPDSNFPGAKFSDFTMKEPDIAADAEMSKIDVDLPSAPLEAPEVDLPSADIETPDIDVDIAAPDVEVSLPEIKTPDPAVPDMDIKTPDIDQPSVGLNMPDIDLPSAGIEVPDVDIKVPDIDLPSTDLDLPDVDLKAPEVDLPDVDTKAPDVDIKAPAVDLPGVDIKTPDIDVPEVGISMPETQDGIDLGDLAKGAVAVAGAAGAGIAAKVGFGKDDFDVTPESPDIKTPELQIDTPDVDVNVEASDISMPELRVDAVASEIPELTVAAPELEIDAEMPKAGVDVEAPEVDFDVAEAGAGLQRPQIKLPVSEEEPELSAPDIDVEAVDVDMQAEVVTDVDVSTALTGVGGTMDTDWSEDKWRDGVTDVLGEDQARPEDAGNNELAGMATGMVAAVVGTAVVSGISGSDDAGDVQPANPVQQSLVELIRAEMALPVSGSAVRIKVLELDDCSCDELELAAENEITLTAGGKGKLSKMPCEVTASELVMVNQKRSTLENGQIALFLDAGIVVCRQDGDYTFAKL